MKITKDFLRSHGACAPSLDLAGPLLPIDLSSNPEENLSVAKALLTQYRPSFSCCLGCHVWWLFDKLYMPPGEPVNPSIEGVHANLHRANENAILQQVGDWSDGPPPFLVKEVAQGLAWCVDPTSPEMYPWVPLVLPTVLGTWG